MGSKDPVRKEGFLEGKLLIALPGMGDPRFEKTVIFMCSHSDDGAMGLIVNKPIDGMPFQNLLEKLKIPISANKIEVPVMFGGPVETERGLVLHSAEYKSGQSTPLIDGVALTGSVDILHAIAAGRGPEKAVFALGYAGWGPGQIEDEIRENGWVHCDADTAILFDMAQDAKWTAALGKLGINMASLSAHTGRA